MRALAFEHLASDPIGIFGDVLAERGIGVDRVLLYADEPVPDWREYDLLIAMGAAESVWQEDEFPWITGEKRAVREAVLAGVPYFGVCFGVQLLADVFGARSFRGPEPEIGVNQVFLTPAAQHDPVFRGFPADLEVCEWHSNHFSLPPGAVRLARSPRYENQAIRYGRVAYGIQCHLETSLDDIRDWLSDGSDAVFEKRHGEGAVARLLEDYSGFVPFLQETARQLFGRWLQNALAFGTSGRAATGAWLGRGPRALERSGLIGRDVELSRIDRAIASARHDESAVLVIRGEPGIGKTALLDAVAPRARDVQVLRAHGALRDADEPFAALAALCRPFADLATELAPPRAAAAASILDPHAAAPLRDRFTVYAAAFDLLVSAAARTPLVLLVDDAHMLDEGSREAIAFIADRLGADGIAMVVATESEDDLGFGEELRLGALEPPEAYSLLNWHWRGGLAPAVAEAVVSAAAGNPLSLLEIPVSLSQAQRAGETEIEGSLPTSAEWSFLTRVSALSTPVRQALLVGALAEPPALATIAAACRKLGLPDSVLEATEETGLVRHEAGGWRFTHPLARTVASYSAMRDDRRAVHRALAEVTEGDAAVWHRARAATEPDEATARDLEKIAVRARDRTAFAAAAEALERGARLTPESDVRARRLLEASRAAHLAGHVNAALAYVDAAIRHATAEPTRRAAEHQRGRILARGGSAELARDQIVTVASRYERTDPGLAAEMLADAVLPALRAGSPSEAVRLATRAERLARGCANGVPLAAQVALGTALVFAGEYQDGAARLGAAAEAAERTTDPQQLVYLGAGLELAGRHDAARRVLTSVIDDARSIGAISILPYALIRLADAHLETGHWSAAAAALHEATRIAAETGQPADQGLALGALAWLAGARGRAEDCQEHAQEALRIAERLGGGSRLDRAGTAMGLLELGRGRASEAIPHLEAACRLQDDRGWSDAARTPHRRPDLIEAYALAGRTDEARSALEVFRSDAEHSRRASALAAVARCRLLLAENSELDHALAAARSAGAEAWGPFDQARTDLLGGAKLLDAGRAQDALPVLGRALMTFEALDARSWADRARGAILTIGGSPPAARKSLVDRLTADELEVAHASAEGAPVAQIAQRLFLGPRTVQMRLASAAIKLGLDSPAALAGVLADQSPDPTAVPERLRAPAAPDAGRVTAVGAADQPRRET